MTSEQLSAQIGRRLAEWRQSRKFRPETFARKLGMTPRAYLAWEQGKRKAWSQFVAEHVGPKGVNVSVRWLFTGRGPMTRRPPDRSRPPELAVMSADLSFEGGKQLEDAFRESATGRGPR